MGTAKAFEKQIAALQAEVRGLRDDFGLQQVESTAARLEGLNFSPPILAESHAFLRMQRQEVLAEIDRILTLPEAVVCALAKGHPKKCQDLRLQYITVLVFYYKKLIALRAGDPGEWDEIDELYVHD